MMRTTIHVIEGVTCSGKTTMLNDICAIMGYSKLQECPPKPPEDYTDDAIFIHQRMVFYDFLRAYWNAQNDSYADFSPLGCIPFEMALYDSGLITKSVAQHDLDTMLRECNNLCKKYRIVLHRFLDIDASVCLNRLRKRNRAGDDTWKVETIFNLVKRYREFFNNSLVLRRGGRIMGVKDSYGI